MVYSVVMRIKFISMLTVGLLLAGCSSGGETVAESAPSTNPATWKTLDDAVAGINEAGAYCPEVELGDSPGWGSCGAMPHGFYVVAVQTDDNPTIVRDSVKALGSDVTAVTVYDNTWSVTCVNGVSPERNCKRLHEVLGGVYEEIVNGNVEHQTGL